ncbi:glycine betaine/L-proline ABC transporter ATP-binding protein, partial [Vibrio parahaemolyticus]|nr:glycine betaine/L-proline ABC transporter ATP-binding protein [Vibrio parahaemolyticus]
HETNAGYQGVITQQGLLNAAKLTHISDWRDDIYEEVPIISPHLAIEQVLTEAMSCEYSLPVIDEHGNLKGELNRQVIAELFSDQRSTKRGTSRSSFNNVS